MEGVRIRLIERAPVRRSDLILVAVIVGGLFHRNAPQALLIQPDHGVGRGVPTVKIPHYADRRRMRRPSAE